MTLTKSLNFIHIKGMVLNLKLFSKVATTKYPSILTFITTSKTLHVLKLHKYERWFTTLASEWQSLRVVRRCGVQLFEG
jgi:hypothetical protein